MATTFEKDWHTRANIQIDNSSQANRAQSFLFLIKQALTGGLGATKGLWTVVGSCDGATFGMDGVDRWTNQSKVLLPANSASSPRGWLVLRSPAGSHLTIEVRYNAVNSWAFRFKASQPAPASGTLTAPPPDTGEEIVATSTSTVNGSLFVTSLADPHRLLYGLAEDGSFFWFLRKELVGSFFSGFILTHFAETRPLETCPVVGWHEFNVSPNAIVLSTISGSVGVSGRATGRGHDGTPASVGLLYLMDGSGSPSVTGPIPELITTDAADGDGSRPDWHVYVSSREASGAPKRSLRGRIQDIRWAPGLPHGTVEPDAQNPRSVAIGYLWFPMSEVPDMT